MKERKSLLIIANKVEKNSNLEGSKTTAISVRIYT